MMSYRKIRRNIKAISPVISVLMMIAVAVAASLVTYAWVMGYLGFTTNKVGKAIQIQSIDGATGDVYVQNVGDSQVTLADAYMNGELVTSSWTDVGGTPLTPAKLNAGDTAVCNIAATFGPGSNVTVKVTTTDGTFIEMTKQWP